jgi:hypothetical protein
MARGFPGYTTIDIAGFHCTSLRHSMLLEVISIECLIQPKGLKVESSLQPIDTARSYNTATLNIRTKPHGHVYHLLYSVNDLKP